MKKALVVLLALCFVGAVAFADMAAPTVKYSVNTWSGLGVYSGDANGQFNGTALEAYDYSWVGGGAVRLGLNYTAADGNSGFASRLQVGFPGVSNYINGGGPVAGANTAFNLGGFNMLDGWAKLFNGMVYVAGGIQNDTTIQTPVWNNFGAINGQFGVYAAVMPVTGLTIGYFQPVPSALTDSAYFGDPAGGGYSVVGASYAIPNIATVELGVTGRKDGYVGGSVTAISGLTISFELDVNTAVSSATAIKDLEDISYAMGPLTVGSYVGVYSSGVSGATMSWGVEPSVAYKINDMLSVTALFNVYNDPGQTWMSPIDAGAFGTAATYGGKVGDTNFGGGAFISVVGGGLTVNIGDYYAAAKNSTTNATAGNVFFVNMDLGL